MIAIATLFWTANQHSRDFSRMYTEEWVEKLYRGFRRNLTQPFRFVCYSEKDRAYSEPIIQQRIDAMRPDYGHCIQPYEMNVPMILVGLDTIVTGNIDHLADYCLNGGKFALPRDPYHPKQACNGVALVPAGMDRIAKDWAGQNDMVHVRSYPHAIIDDILPGQVVSYKGHVKQRGLGDARIVYFHGEEKPHQLRGNEITEKHWI